MEYKVVNIAALQGRVEVREDGNEILYNGKAMKFHLVKSSNHQKGYYQLSMSGKRFYVHKLVAMAFVKNNHPLSRKFVMHKDSDSLNNNPSNLAWCDRKQAVQNSRKNKPATPDSYRGSSKIPYEEALKIVERLKQGEYAKDICKEYGVSEMSITRIRKRYGNEPGTKRFSKEVKETVLRLLQKHTPAELVAITGINYHTLYRWNKEVQKK